MTKEILFISHATHEDDYPAGWLASKLEQLGYKVFIDLDDLRVGDTFYTVIQPVIQKETFKFITINTANYIKKAGDPNSGVRKEINTAATVTTDKKFIVPVRFDNINFGDFPMDYVMRNSIDFYNRWGEALNELIKELEELGTPKNNTNKNPLALWHKAIRNKNKVIEQPETLYSNWFEIHLPEFIYIHKPDNVERKLFGQIPATTILEANQIISFASKETVESFIPLLSSKRFKTEDFLTSEQILVDEKFILIKPYDKLKQLLNKSFKSHCFKRGLKAYEQASEKEVLYFRFTKDTNKPVSISLKKYRKTRTQVNGNKWGKNWHFAISARTELQPFPHYRVFYHVIFTDNELKPITDTDEQHSLRRKFSGILYNKKVFEMLLASMLYLSFNREGEFVEVQIGINEYMRFSNLPLSFHLNKSYVEPKSPIQNDSL
jgi:hypothetical protein